MFAHGTGGTLTIQGIDWRYLKYNGKLALQYGHHAIIFDHQSGYYLIKQRGETVFASHGITDCLENVTECVLDYHARQIVPSWEN